MLNAPHPDDERLSALAFTDHDAIADAALTSHVATCTRCTDLVNELGALRASLAELPDLQPSRPLRLLPPGADAPVATGAGTAWVRRLFAPALTAGAALAMVGLIGTATPVLNGAAGGAATGMFENAGEPQQGGGDATYEALSSTGDDGAPAEAPGAELGRDLSSAAARAPEDAAASEAPLQPDAITDEDQARASRQPTASGGDGRLASELPAERSPWPMVLFAGVALMVGAAVLRWIMAPRAG